MASPYSCKLDLCFLSVTGCAAGAAQIRMPPNVSEAATSEALKAKRPDDCRGVVFYKRECIPTSTFLSREIFNYFCFSLNSFLFRSIVPQFPSQFLLRGHWPRQDPRKLRRTPCHITSVK